MISRAERNYEGKRWVSYGRQFRREAPARRDLNWMVTDPRLYNEAFTGRARAIARCQYCLQDDHLAAHSLMAAVICTKFPHKAPELFAYQTMISRAERNYEGKRWPLVQEGGPGQERPELVGHRP